MLRRAARVLRPPGPQPHFLRRLQSRVTAVRRILHSAPSLTPRSHCLLDLGTLSSAAELNQHAVVDAHVAIGSGAHGLRKERLRLLRHHAHSALVV